jgi:hypothetical protein
MRGESPNPPPPEQIPDISQGNALMSGAPPMQQNALMGNGAPGVQSSPPAQPSPPTHAQTVAALRHFDAIKGVLTPLLQDPALGKSSMKSQIIDGVTKLVSERIISAGKAVDELSKIPADPLLQRKILQGMMQNAIQAERVILAHHAMGFAGQGPEPIPSTDSHMDYITALHANYSRGR